MTSTSKNQNHVTSTTTDSQPRPLGIASAGLVLLTTALAFGQDGRWVARVLLGLVSAAVLMIAAFMAPVRGSSFMALDGSPEFRRTRNIQIIAAVMVAGLLNFVLPLPVALMAGMIAAVACGQTGRKEAESGGE